MTFSRVVDFPRLGLLRRKSDFSTLADRARDAGQWERAAQLYRKALNRNPRNRPIWVQYGHALKESGELRDPDKLAQAELAYRRALSLDPSAADPHLHLGHVLKLQGKSNEAEACYLRALVLDPSMPYPLHELGGLGWSEAQMAELKGLVALDAPPSAALLSEGSLVAFSRPPAQPRETGPPLAKSNDPASGGLKEDIRTIRDSGLFDEAYYQANNPDLPQDIDAVRHFLERGAREGRMPNRMFDPAFYLSQSPDVTQSGENPLVHFIRHGAGEGRRTHRDEWYSLYDTVSDEDRLKIKLRLAQLQYQPHFTVVLWAGSSSTEFLRAAVASVSNQLYTSWELWIAVGGSIERPVRDVAGDLCSKDQRIKVVEQPISRDRSAALNAVLEMATGEFIAFMNSNGELAETALYMVAEELGQHPETDIIYSDEDTIDANGRRYQPHFKSDWNLDLFYGYNYVGDLIVCRASSINIVGGLRSGFDGAEIYDLLLRIAEKTTVNHISHIPFILYHCRAPELPAARLGAARTHAANAERRALSEHFLRTGQQGVEVIPGPRGEFHRIVWPVPHPKPLVSLVIPTGGKVELLTNCLSGILNRTDYDNIELIILYNTSTRPEVFPYFDEISTDPRVTIVDSRGGFNFSRICNLGVERARGQIIGLINDDIEVIEPGWLTEMVSHALRPGIGAVGALLYYPNDRIQHAGIVTGVGGVAGCAHLGLPRGNLGNFGRAALVQNLSAVTAACLVMPKTVFGEVGAFNKKDLSVAYNDVDLCLRICKAGYKIVWTPHAELYHDESATRGPDTDPDKVERFRAELAYMKQQWGHILDQDPYYNPNLALDGNFSGLAFPPRVDRPWRRDMTEQARIARFDAKWYLQRYPDVARAGGDPLDHFLRHGLREGRKANAEEAKEVWKPNAPQAKSGFSAVTDAEIHCLKQPSFRDEVALFATHSPHGRLKPHVPHYLDSLKRQGIAVILIVAADRPFSALDTDLVNGIDGMFIRRNEGYDFAAWAHILLLHPELFDANILYLLNDSMIGPTNDASFGNMLTRLRNSPAGFIGLTENCRRGWHIQSYFLALKRRALSSIALHKFINDIVSYKDIDDVITEFEVRFASTLKSAGIDCEPMFRVMDFRDDPTVYWWNYLLQSGFPFVKVKTIRGMFAGADVSDWRERLAGEGYDVSVAERTVAEANAPSQAGASSAAIARKSLLSLALSSLVSNGPKVAFIGPWNYDNGEAEASRGYISALRHTGLQVNFHPIRRPFHIHHHVAPAVDMCDFTGPADVAIVHVNPHGWPGLLTEAQMEIIKRARVTIGLWVWEMAHLPANWYPHFDEVDAIWAPSRYCADIFVAKARVTVEIIPHVVTVDPSPLDPVRAAAVRWSLGLSEDDRIILYAFDGSSYLIRKNPFALVRSFARSRLAEKGWRLVLKTKHLFESPVQGRLLQQEADRAQGVVVVDRSADKATMGELMRVADVYASPHCSEGFGLTIAEAMAMGKIVVATDYGGSRDFLDAGCAFPVRYRPEPLDEDHGSYTRGGIWAQIDEAHLAEVLIEASELVTAGDTRLGEAARRRIDDLFSPASVSAKMRKSITRLLGIG